MAGLRRNSQTRRFGPGFSSKAGPMAGTDAADRSPPFRAFSIAWTGEACDSGRRQCVGVRPWRVVCGGKANAASSPVMSAADRGRPADRRSFHDHEARSLQMLDKALRHDRRHHLAGIVDELPPA